MGYLVFDIETSISKESGASPYDPENKAYVVISKQNKQPIKVRAYKEGIKHRFPFSLDGIKVIVGHNLKFDLSYFWECEELQNFLRRGGTIWDTQYAEFLLTAQQHKFPALKDLSKKYLKENMKEDRITNLCFKKGIGSDKIINHPRAKRLKALFKKYCIADVEMTEQVFLRQIKAAKRAGMFNLIKTYNHYLLYQCEEQYNGIFYSVDNSEEEVQKLLLTRLSYLELLDNSVQKHWNKSLPAFNFNSKDHLSALIYGGNLKYKIKEQEGFYKNGNPKMRVKEKIASINAWRQPVSSAKKTKKPGVYVVDENVLEELSGSENEELSDFCTTLLKCRKVEKLIGTYYKPNLKAQRDGIIHQEYNNCLIPTGRLSCKSPNMQNQHPKVKHLYPSRWGKDGIICELDFGQLEIVVQAWLAGCDRMLRHTSEGLDFHCKRLSYAVGKSYDDVVDLCQQSEEWQLKRKKAKGVSFQKSYGAAPKSIAASTGLDEETVIKIFEAEDREYPEIGQFYKMVNEDIMRTSKLTQQLIYIKDKATGNEYTDSDERRHIGYYQSVTGKRYHFYDKAVMTRRGLFKYWPQPNVYNFPVQGTAADIQAATSAELLDFLIHNRDKVLAINEVHDSKIFDIKLEHADEVIPKLKDIMSRVSLCFSKWYKLNVEIDIDVDVEIGYTWGKLVPYTGDAKEDLSERE